MQTQTLTDNDALEFTFDRPCRIGFVVGPTGGATFGGGAIAISQDGVPYTGHTSINGAKRGDLEVMGGSPVVFALTGATSPNLTVKVWVLEARTNTL